MRALTYACGAIAVLIVGGCQAPSGTLVGSAPPPIYRPAPPPPPYYGPPPSRCYYQDGPYGPERVCRRDYY